MGRPHPVKTFGPRGTVHLLATADLPMWTGALTALPPSVPVHPEPVQFTPEQTDEVIAAIGDALADADLTVDELTEAIADRTWRGIIHPLGAGGYVEHHGEFYDFPAIKLCPVPTEPVPVVIGGHSAAGSAGCSCTAS